MADNGLNPSGSLTEKDIQLTQTSTSLLDERGHARELIFELKNVLESSGIHELREWMAAVQDSMMNMEMLVVAQTSKMGEMMSAFETLAKEPLAKARTTSLKPSQPPSPASKPDRPSQDPILLPTAVQYGVQGAPIAGGQSQLLKSSHSSRPNVSGESDVEKSPNKLGSFYSRNSRKSAKSERSSVDLDVFSSNLLRCPMTMQDLEEHRASQLLRSCALGGRPKSRRQTSKQSAADPARSSSHRAVKPEIKSPRELLPEPEPAAVLPNGKRKAFTMNSKLGGEDKAAVLEKCQRVSLEELRMNYDAVISEFNTTKTSKTNPDESGEVSALPRLARCLLCMAGHLRFKEGLASRCFAIFSYGILPLAISGLLVYGGAVSDMDTSLLLSLTCFQLGISVASFSFEQKGIALLLGPQETRLDDYALEADFIADWQKVSRKRFVETICMYIGMLCLRFASYVWIRGQFELPEDIWDPVYGAAFWFMLFRYLLLCYSILHCCCGLELALDSFGVRFFREMDIEQALGEWNTLQATLRQASTKVSDSFLVIGFCCLATMALLGEKVIRNPRDFVQTTGQMTSWLSRFYPLMIVFLYTMMRAAAVTEKANRVAPLVNSWKFHNSHHDDDDDGLWMDHERQYAVQYISQSRAGFFIRGSQLTVPTVQKLLYYLGAVSFALFSRLSAV